jgi:hypothetical protein
MWSVRCSHDETDDGATVAAVDPEVYALSVDSGTEIDVGVAKLFAVSTASWSRSACISSRAGAAGAATGWC